MERDNKSKANKPQIKVYFETYKEVEEVQKLAKTHGLSASAWFREWAKGQMGKRGKIK